jgi:major membrane immunogen (membrane-anchored lipoprotein)
MEKMFMKISEKDYSLLVGVAEFHFKFAEYIRESDSDMFYRAIDYARTYNKQFLSEMSAMLLKIQNSYDRCLRKFENETIANEAWMKKKKTTQEDILGIKNYIQNFTHHMKELEYENFDETDWRNFSSICFYIKDEKYKIFALDQMKKYLGENHIIIKEFSDGNKN